MGNDYTTASWATKSVQRVPAVFAKNRTFERHRIGTFGKDRRCMDDEQMSASFSLGVDGFWRGKPKEGSGVAWGAAKREASVPA